MTMRGPNVGATSFWLSDAIRFSRRTAFQTGIAAVSSYFLTSSATGQPKLDSSESTPQLNRFPRMMQEYISEKLLAAETIGRARRAAISSADDARSYLATIRSLIGTCFGRFPDRTPLNARVTGIVERDTHRIEKVIFESRPGFLVTGNLYVPKGRKLPLPGVVGSCGHSVNGKAAEAYQSFSQGLARLGYVVLIFDPIGQGERLQYPDEFLKSKVGAGVHEHLIAGNQQFLVDEFFGTWRAWDAMRALDYLLTRQEVDPMHVGITGNSGGGTMTIWLCGVEQRWTMAAPSCAVTTFRRNFQNELPTDTEQCPPSVLQYGLDHVDFLAAMAPKPVIIIAAEKDYFDVRGAIETYERLRPIYRSLGASDKIQIFIGPNEHGYSQPNREAMYEFFNTQVGIVADRGESNLTIEKDETLWCTPNGQVVDIGSKTVVSFTQTKSKVLANERGLLRNDDVRKRVSLLIPDRPVEPPEFEILRPVAARQYPMPNACWYAIETEKHVRSIVCRVSTTPWYSRPPAGPGRVTLFVSHQSSDLELRTDHFVRQLILDEPETEFFAMDVRGVGDSRPQTCGENQFLSPYGNDYFYAAHSIMLGLPYPVQRAFDVLRVVDWIKSFGRNEIHLVALGWGTIPATLTAVISDDVCRVTLKNALRSFAEIAESDHYDWPISAFIPGVLRQFDLPDCYRVLADKQLKQIEPCGAISVSTGIAK